jgi:hypothetical protein
MKGKAANGRTKRIAWTKENIRDLKAHSKSKTPVAKISKLIGDGIHDEALKSQHELQQCADRMASDQLLPDLLR